jgi:hypothetical protein
MSLSRLLWAVAVAILATSTITHADVLYSNGGGSTFGALGSQPVNDGSSTTNPFTIQIDDTHAVVNGLNFVLWVPIGDTATSIAWSITSSPFGTLLASGDQASLPNDFIAQAVGGSDLVYDEFFSIPDLPLAAGTYWLQLSDATTTHNGAVGWDQAMNGPTAYVNDTGTQVPGELFQISGTAIFTPEPSTFSLFGTGLLGMIGVARRKLTS